MRTGLIIVDAQVDFCPGGALPVPRGNEVCENIADDLFYAYDFVVLTKDWHKMDDSNGGHISDRPDYVNTWPPHCIATSPGSEFQEAIFNKWVISPWNVFCKGYGVPAYSGFEGDRAGVPLHDYLQKWGIKELDICGIAGEYCVKATAIDAVRLGYKTRVLEEKYTACFNGVRKVQEEIDNLSKD